MTTEHVSLQEAVDTINNLRPHEIADLFQDEGVTATPCDPYNCAVAQYLTAKTGHKVRSGLTIVGIVDTHHTAFLSRSVSDFIVGFDHGAYPQLTTKSRELVAA